MSFNLFWAECAFMRTATIQPSRIACVSSASANHVLRAATLSLKSGNPSIPHIGLLREITGASRSAPQSMTRHAEKAHERWTQSWRRRNDQPQPWPKIKTRRKEDMTSQEERVFFLEHRCSIMVHHVCGVRVFFHHGRPGPIVRRIWRDTIVRHKSPLPILKKKRVTCHHVMSDVYRFAPVVRIIRLMS